MSTEDLSYFQEEEFKKNLALYEQMLQGGQSVYLEADELTDIAEYYLVQNDTDKAMACIQYALNIHPVVSTLISCTTKDVQRTTSKVPKP